MVHGIPCFDLPVRTEEREATEPSILERVGWNRSIKNKNYLKISSPIRLHHDEEDRAVHDTPVESDAHKSTATNDFRPSPIQLEFVASQGEFTVRDLSPQFDSKFSPNFDSSGLWATADASDIKPLGVSARGRPLYPGWTKIPEELPCHQRYVPMSRSRSTRVLESQIGRFSDRSKTALGQRRLEEDQEASDISSVYSQESADGVIPFYIEAME